MTSARRGCGDARGWNTGHFRSSPLSLVGAAVESARMRMLPMIPKRIRRVWSGILAASIMMALSCRPGLAQFSTHDGYAPDGSYRVQVELSPYVWLPALDATLGLERPPGFDISINRPRPTVSDLASTLNGAFLGDGLVRFGPWSAELDVDWIAATVKKTFPALTNVPSAALKLHDSLFYVSPGVGYQLIPDFAPDKISFDVRAGFSYFETTASASFAQSRFGGVDVTYNFTQPWVGLRADYYPSPRWRIDLAGAGTGLGVDGAWGWNAKASLAYLFTRWFDVSLGYAALGTDRNVRARPDGSSKNLHLVAYGPVLALGFRFPPMPAPLPAAIPPIAIPAPAPARTYLVFFDWDRADLTARARQVIAYAAEASRVVTVTRLEVNGYTDTSGTPRYNQRLSIRRAQAVAGELVHDGVPGNVIEIHGYGETHLLVPTGPGIREPQNRRVEIILK